MPSDKTSGSDRADREESLGEGLIKDQETQRDVRHYQLVLLPYVGMSGQEELRVGRARLWSFDHSKARISDPRLRHRISELVSMYREQGRDPSKGIPLRGVGIVSIGTEDFHVLSDGEFQEVQELRHVVFLCCLANNTRLGPNGGHMMVTAENFDVVRQGFGLDDDHLAEQTGALIQMRIMGYRIKETRFIRPTYVNQPSQFRYDAMLFAKLKLLRRKHRRLYRRVTRAVAVFLESYYNSQRVDVRARVVLQVAAFEILLDLPEKAPRKVFKETIESLLSDASDRKYRYKFQIGNRMEAESRTIKGIWADRFYTLRNHIAHGETIRPGEYVFRGAQHHLVISPLVFVSCIKRLVDEALINLLKQRPFFERLEWGQIRKADEFDEEVRGFYIREDFARRFSEIIYGPS